MNFYDDYIPRRRTEHKESQYHHRIELRNGAGQLIGEVNDFQDLQWVVNAEANDAEASKLTLSGSSSYARTFMRANTRILLVHIHLYRADKLVKQWTGRVDRAVRTKEGPQSTVQVELISDKAWLQYIMCWSAPFLPIDFQAPKTRLKLEPAIFGMKQYLIDNLLRLQSSHWNKPSLSLYHQRPAEWATIQSEMYPLIVVPTQKSEDTSPVTALIVQMTPAASMMSEVCKDFNLLPTVRFHVPGRDPAPPRVLMTRPGIVIDIEDKEKSRARRENPSFWGQFTETISVFVRGMFGRFDSPPQIDTESVEGLRDFFGTHEDDPWVIFRDSPKHWNRTEVAAYAPQNSTSISGGKAHDFLNKGISLIVNGAIQWALSLIGIGFVGNLITGELDDILFAYQKADDWDMREQLGEYTFFESYEGQGTTAYSTDSAQALRSARWAAVGYKTATFVGDAASIPPFRPFEDFDLLDPVGWEDSDEDTIFPDRLKEITVREDRSGVSFEFRLGELDRPEEPWAVQQRQNQRFNEALNVALMAN